MKKIVRSLTVASLTFAFTQPLFAADQVATTGMGATSTTSTTSTTGTTTAAPAKAKAMSMSNLLQQLQKAGYIVKSVELNADDGVYKVDAVDRHGDKQGLDLNAATGLTPEQKKVPHEISLSQAAKKLEKNGAHVTAISADTSGYKVTVVDSKGNQQDYTVDPTSGKVTQ